MQLVLILHRVDVDIVVDVSEVNTAFIFIVEVSVLDRLGS
jgi:hypothetical protein